MTSQSCGDPRRGFANPALYRTGGKDKTGRCSAPTSISNSFPPHRRRNRKVGLGLLRFATNTGGEWWQPGPARHWPKPTTDQQWRLPRGPSRQCCGEGWAASRVGWESEMGQSGQMLAQAQGIFLFLFSIFFPISNLKCPYQIQSHVLHFQISKHNFNMNNTFSVCHIIIIIICWGLVIKCFGLRTRQHKNIKC
jgi:hypothetical protein